jgi:hypothetical protein
MGVVGLVRDNFSGAMFHCRYQAIHQVRILPFSGGLWGGFFFVSQRELKT